MRKYALIICLLIYVTEIFPQTNIFGHYETTDVSKYLLHLRPDSTYILYYVSDIGPFPRPQYEDFNPEPFTFSKGSIRLMNVKTSFDSIFTKTDSIHLKPNNYPSTLLKKVFYHDNGTIKYVIQNTSEGYKLKYYQDNSATLSMNINKNDQLHGEYFEYYPIHEPLKTEAYQFLIAGKDSLNWNLLISVMDLNSILKIEGFWQNDEKEGLWTHYNRDGTINKKEKWKKGKLKKSY